MAKEPMVLKSIRVPDATWRAAIEAAGRKGDNLSEEIRKFLARYGRS